MGYCTVLVPKDIIYFDIVLRVLYTVWCLALRCSSPLYIMFEFRWYRDMLFAT